MVMTSIENFLETLQKKFISKTITIRRNFNSIWRDLRESHLLRTFGPNEYWRKRSGIILFTCHKKPLQSHLYLKYMPIIKKGILSSIADEIFKRIFIIFNCNGFHRIKKGHLRNYAHFCLFSRIYEFLTNFQK